MKRRTFLKYLCSVVPVALVDPMYFAKDDIPDTVSFGAIYPSSQEAYLSYDRFCDDLLIGIIKREGWSDSYVYIKD